jgi:predicted nucleotide-binding protein
MDEISVAFAKLAGIRKGLESVLYIPIPGRRPEQAFQERMVRDYFEGVVKPIATLSRRLPSLFDELPKIRVTPGSTLPNGGSPVYGRPQVEKLARLIDQIFEIRANSELASPALAARDPRVFISHGRAKDWLEVQTYIERDTGISTLELAQEANLGRSVLQKLEQESNRCTSAVIVMTGDDTDSEGNSRARENVLHEIGYCQARFGLAAVCLLHEEATSIPSNIHGLVYIPFPKGYVSATFGALGRELKALYR